MLNTIPAEEIERLIKSYNDVQRVSSGDPVADSHWKDALQMVISDLRSLFEDATNADFDDPDRPFIPQGFKLHAVIH